MVDALLASATRLSLPTASGFRIVAVKR
jgi:hypothetical protein